MFELVGYHGIFYLMSNSLVVFLSVILFTRTTMSQGGDLWDDVSSCLRCWAGRDTENEGRKIGEANSPLARVNLATGEVEFGTP